MFICDVVEEVLIVCQINILLGTNTNFVSLKVGYVFGLENERF